MEPASENIKSKIKPDGVDVMLASLAPAFIIGMIGALVYFLITVCYEGQYRQRLMWILGLYTLASVLVARIAIEQSRAISFTYMIALAGATLFVAPSFFVLQNASTVVSLIVLVFLLAMIAYLSDRITFDCTMIDERTNSAGIGILQSLGLVNSDRRKLEDKRRKISKPLGDKSANSRKHNPGVWVLYFALVAIPLFGVGQFVIRDSSDRRWAFTCLITYLFCSLCLLVLIALLSLRKYLRERSVTMETSFAIRWLSIGFASVAVIVGLLWFVPTSNTGLLSMDLPFRLTSRDDLKANQWGWGNEGAEEQQGQRQQGQGQQGQGQQGQQGQGQQGQGQQGQGQQGQGQQGQGQQGQGQQGQGQQGQAQQGQAQQRQAQQGQAQQGQQGQSMAPGGQSQNDAAKSEGGKEPGKRDGGENQQAQKNGQENQKGNQQAGQQPPAEKRQEFNQVNDPKEQQQRGDQPKNDPPANAPPKPASKSWSIEWNLAGLLQWLLLAVLAVVSIVFGFKHRKQLWLYWRGVWDWLANLLGRREPSNVANDLGPETLVKDPFPPFESFANPFESGNKWSAEKLIRHTYQAILSWGYGHRVTQREDETPEEYVRRLSGRFPQQQESFLLVGKLYSRVAYANAAMGSLEPTPIRDLWKWLLENSPADR
jgi:hypothetical protein